MAPIESLPNEVIVIIAQVCSVPETARLARTSRRFHALLNGRIYRRNARDEPPQESCLLWAAAFGRIDTLDMARANGTDMNVSKSWFARHDPQARAPEGDEFRGYIFPSPLHIAVIHGDRRMVEFLLDNGAVLEAPLLEFEQGGQPSFMSRPGLDTLRFRGRQDDIDIGPWICEIDMGLGRFYREIDMGTWKSLADWVPEINLFADEQHLYNQSITLEGYPHTYPLQFALANRLTEDLVVYLIQRGARRISRDTLALNMAIASRRMTLFDDLLQQHEGDIARRDGFVLAQLRRAIEVAPMDTVRSIFPRLWNAGIANSSDGDWAGASFFVALVTGRLGEALGLLEALGNTPLDEYFQRVSLHHCWYHSILEPQPSPMEMDKDFEDARLGLSKALVERNVGVNHDARAGVLYGRAWLAPLYMVAMDSSASNHATKAMELLLSAGASQMGTGYNVGLRPEHKLLGPLLSVLVVQAFKNQNVSKFEQRIILALKYGGKLAPALLEWDFDEEIICAWPGPEENYPLLKVLLDNASKEHINLSSIRSAQQNQRGKEQPKTQVMLSEFVRREFPDNILPWDQCRPEDYYPGWDDNWQFI